MERIVCLKSVCKVTPTGTCRGSVRYASESGITVKCTVPTLTVTVGKWPHRLVTAHTYCGSTLLSHCKATFRSSCITIVILVFVVVIAAAVVVVVTVLQSNKRFHLNLAMKRVRLWSSCLTPEQTLNICTQTCRTLNATVAQSKNCLLKSPDSAHKYKIYIRQ
jgi:hypothetical protein